MCLFISFIEVNYNTILANYQLKYNQAYLTLIYLYGFLNYVIMLINNNLVIFKITNGNLQLQFKRGGDL